MTEGTEQCGSRPEHLTVEHLIAPLGLGPASPRLSWWLPRRAGQQLAYRVQAGDWDSGRVESDQQLFVPTGVRPTSGLAVEWRVKVWTDLGESEWSEPSSWEHGLLGASDWRARWVAPREEPDAAQRQRPVHQLAGSLTLRSPVVRARLHATAHGIYEAFVNGVRVGDEELTPGFTAYRQRLQVQTFDVTSLLRSGDNVVGALLSDGWWRGQHGVSRRVDDYGRSTALLLQLHVECADGTTLVWGSDAGWRSTPSHVTAADLIAGERHDHRARQNWMAWEDWQPVRVEDHGYENLVGQCAPAIRRIEDLRPVSVRSPREGSWVVDLGQNINGWVRLGRLGPRGSQVRLTYGEWLGADGCVTQANVAQGLPLTADRVPFQVDEITSSGDPDDVFEPRHSTKGFQYVQVDGWVGELAPADVTGVVVHTDLPVRGGFRCSDPRLNRLHDIATWSFRGNACGIPTDCPTRERSGWTGDWQLFAETAAFLYDIGGFATSWLRDLAADQRPDGKVTNLVPEPHPGDDRPPASWPDMEGSAGWGDAAVHVPWVIHRTTGDTGLLEQQWSSAKAWVDFAARTAAGDRHPLRAQRSPEPLPHERFLWDAGWHFGEWLEPGQSLEAALKAARSSDHGPVATAYLYRSSRELADIAAVLGRDADQRFYAGLADAVRAAWREEFVGESGQLSPDTQANHVRALSFGLVDEGQRPAVAARLAALVREAGNHVGTGFLATPFLLPVLAENGHLDLAYELLLQDTVPSWLAMVDRGATTVWEEWEGVDSEGVAHASLNHYSKGAVIDFFHRHVAGLQVLDPAYRRFVVAPQAGGGLTQASVFHDCPYGRIEVSWTSSSGDVSLDLLVPAGTVAEVRLPGCSPQQVGPGRHRLVADSSTA